MKYSPVPAKRRYRLPTYCRRPRARKSGAVLSVAAIVTAPAAPSSGVTAVPAAAGVTATFWPETNDSFQFQRPILSGEKCARHLLPEVADVLPALPSAAKYPGTA